MYEFAITTLKPNCRIQEIFQIVERIINKIFWRPQYSAVCEYLGDLCQVKTIRIATQHAK